MEEETSQMVTVSVVTLGGTAEEAILITVPRDAPLGDVKKALADMFERPEIASDGRFLKKMPNGATVNMHDNQKLGSRKELIYEGPALALAPEAAPLLTLEEFDGFDEKVEVQSPRSLRALELQGVVLDELYYAPPECFWEPGLDTMIVKLHHDFFEAWRQDTLDMCRLQRDRVMSEGPGEEAQLDQSTREWMISVNSSKPEAGATRMEQPAEKSCIPRFYNTESSPGERIYGTGGNWSGILEPHAYPLTMQFFEDLQYWMQPDKVFERTYQGQEKLMKQSHGAKPSPKGISIPERLDLDAPGIKVKDASKEVAKMVGELQRIPREAKRPQAVSLASNTLSVAVVQRSENAKARRAAVKDVVSHAESMASLAEGQREATDAHIKEPCSHQLPHFCHEVVIEITLVKVNLWRGHREACSQESRGSWKNEAQERNFANAYRRAEHWYKRREAVHESEMEAEEKRYEATIKIAQRDVAVTMRVGRIRDLTRIKFARQWLERRIRWAKQETITSKKNEAWKAATLQKQDDAQARIHDHNVRWAKFIEFKKEFLALRRTMCRMAADREFKRQHQRRKDIATHLTSFAEKAEAAKKSQAESQMEAFLSNKDLAWKRRSFKSMHSLSAGKLSAQASWSTPERTSTKRFPRFDFGRFGAESLTGSTSGSTSQQMQKSASSPAVAA